VKRGPPLPLQGSHHVVTITGLDDEGRGRALLDEDEGDDVRVDVAVRGAVPGDTVDMFVERVFPARRLLVGRATRWLAQGEARADRICEHPSPCVGCPLDRLEPSAILELKRARVLRALEDADLDLEVEDVISQWSATGYRQKVKLVAGGRAGHLRLGLFAPHTHNLVPADKCVTHREDILEATEALKGLLNSCHVPPVDGEEGTLKAVFLRAFEEGVGAVLVVREPLHDVTWARLSGLVKHQQLFSLAERVDDSPGNSLLGGHLERVHGPAVGTPLEGGLPVPVDAFCQADPHQAKRMYAWVADRAVEDLADGEWVLDAYAGTGGFSRFVLQRRPEAHVVAVERATPCLAALHGTGAEVLARDVAGAATDLQRREPPAVVIADPPRRGLSDEAAALGRLGARRFFLVSCDPDAMARDITALAEHGYRPVLIQPLDLFWGTPEVEVLTVLERAPA
jgi:23S rRNA (uracil1939-C5)-methyltransferase